MTTIKHFCDRCKIECNNLFPVRIPKEKVHKCSYTTQTIEVCESCRKIADEINDAALDFKISIFNRLFVQKETNKDEL